MDIAVTSDACFSGNYPVHFDDEDRTRQLHLFKATYLFIVF